MWIRGLDTCRPSCMCGGWLARGHTCSPRLRAGEFENGGMMRPSSGVGACAHRGLDRGWTRGGICRLLVLVQVLVEGRGSAMPALSWGAQGIRKHRLRTRCVDLSKRLIAVHHQQGCHGHMDVRRSSDGLVRIQPINVLIVRRDGCVELRKGPRDGGMGVGNRGEDSAAWGRFDGADARGRFVWC